MAQKLTNEGRSMIRWRAKYVLLAVFALLTTAFGTSCGKSSSPVVTVGQTAITEAAVEQRIAELAPGREVPDPPSFSRCIAGLRARGGSTQTPTSTLSGACRGRYEQLRQRAISSLIAAGWIKEEARELGLRPAGGESASVAARTSTQIRHYVIRKIRQGNSAQLSAYYGENPQLFVTPEGRDVNVVRTKSLAAGMRARAEIESGIPFAAVARAISVDGAGKRNGGLLADVVRSQEDPQLRRAVFSAKLRMLTGPVMLEPGRYYLFEVWRIKPAHHQTLAEFKAERTPQLQQQGLKAYAQSFMTRWAAQTSCHKGYLAPGCSDYYGAQSIPEQDLYALNEQS